MLREIADEVDEDMDREAAVDGGCVPLWVHRSALMKKENLLKITDLRHELHMYPELSMQERETADRIKTFLRENTHFRIVDRGN